MKRRAAVEPVIGHLKAEHRMDRNYLKGRDGDRTNAVLALPATTSPSSCAGSGGFCAPSSRRSSRRRSAPNISKIAAQSFFTDDGQGPCPTLHAVRADSDHDFKYLKRPSRGTTGTNHRSMARICASARLRWSTPAGAPARRSPYLPSVRCVRAAGRRRASRDRRTL
jgi:hypothetical protein